MLSIAIFEFILSVRPSLYVIGSIVILGALEGVLEEYFKFKDKRILEVAAATEDDHSIHFLYIYFKGYFGNYGWWSC